MKKTRLIIVLFVFILTLGACSSNDMLGDEYYDPSNGGEQDTPTFDADPNFDLENGGGLLNTASQPSLATRKIIYTADIALISTDTNETYNNVLNAVSAYDAYISAEEITAKKIEIVIRVNSTSFNDIIEDLKTEGELISFTKSSEDVTNDYSTFEARKLALETQHARILELIEIAATLEDLLLLEEQRTEIETELNEIAIVLSNYDSLIDYSTINLTITKIESLSLLLDKSSEPSVSVKEVEKTSAQVNIANNSDEETTIYLNVKDNGETIQQYERTLLPGSKETVTIGDLSAGTEYRIEVESLQVNHLVSNMVTRTFETKDTFISTLGMIFVASVDSLVFLGQALLIAVVAIVPYAVIGGLLFIPFKKLVLDKRVKKENPTLTKSSQKD